MHVFPVKNRCTKATGYSKHVCERKAEWLLPALLLRHPMTFDVLLLLCVKVAQQKVLVNCTAVSNPEPLLLPCVTEHTAFLFLKEIFTAFLWWPCPFLCCQGAKMCVHCSFPVPADTCAK